MRQQVNVNVDLTYDVDANLSRSEIILAIMEDLNRLENFGMHLKQAEYMGASITNILEEAEIYGNI